MLKPAKNILMGVTWQVCVCVCYWPILVKTVVLKLYRWRWNHVWITDRCGWGDEGGFGTLRQHLSSVTQLLITAAHTHTVISLVSNHQSRAPNASSPSWSQMLQTFLPICWAAFWLWFSSKHACSHSVVLMELST